MTTLNVFKLHLDAPLPVRAYEESAAYDITAYNPHRSIMVLAPHTTKLIGTGLAMRPPRGYLILVCSRSGLATKGIFVANSPGVVDPDYTGEIKVALFNGSLEPYYIKHGDRIAQVLTIPFVAGGLREVTSLPETPRGGRGFGSTGA